MKKFFLNNLGLKLASLVIGIIAWVLVVNALDPVTSFTITRVPVVLENTEAITGLNKVYSIISGGTVNITVQAKKTDQTRITAADFLVTADMSMAYGSNPERQAVNLSVRVVNNNNIIEGWTLGTNTTLLFSTEDIISRRYAVEIEPSGTLSDSYRLSDLQADPAFITVRGPQSAMASVARVVVRPDITPLTPETPEVTAAPLVLNGNDTQIANPDLTIDAEEVSVSASLYHTKTLAVTSGGVSGAAADGYRYVGYETSVDNVVVQGSRADLANINSIVIPASELGISGAVSNMSFTVDLRNLLPEGVTLAQNEPTSVVVTAQIEKLESKTLQIPVSQITVNGRANNLIYTIPQTSVSITVVGLKTDLDVLSADSISMAIDAEGLNAGYYTLTANVTLPSGYSLNTPASVGLRITPEETEPSTEEPTQPSSSETAASESESEAPVTEEPVSESLETESETEPEHQINNNTTESEPEPAESDSTGTSEEPAAGN